MSTLLFYHPPEPVQACKLKTSKDEKPHDIYQLLTCLKGSNHPTKVKKRHRLLLQLGLGKRCQNYISAILR